MVSIIASSSGLMNGFTVPAVFWSFIQSIELRFPADTVLFFQKPRASSDSEIFSLRPQGPAHGSVFDAGSSAARHCVEV
ncbi:MAG: hypothetical protein EBS38_08820 [Actinobacteria bacterium]|nr:hypothetical protein [Actinomycetota bacterium]